MKHYTFAHRHRLPKRAGVYVLHDRNFAPQFGGSPEYVGRSNNVHRRWNEDDHHQLAFWRARQKHLVLSFSPYWAVNCKYREAAAIKKLHPKRNEMFPRPRDYWTPLAVLEDIWDGIVRGIPMAIAVVGFVVAASVVFPEWFQPVRQQPPEKVNWI